MITFPPRATLSAGVVEDLRDIARGLQAESPADTVACAYGVGNNVRVWYDESDGRYFDLASLTKPLFTVPTVLSLLSARGALDEPVGNNLSWLQQLPRAPTARQLLTHASGLPAELPTDGDASQVRVWVTEAVRASGRDFITYSDVNYWLLGELACTMTGDSLAVLFARAPTATDDAFVFGQAPAQQSVPAGPAIGGTRLVHDGAARRLGLSGHAGAFGTLAGVVHAVVAWLDRGWLPEVLATEALTCQTHTTPGGHRSIAWTLAGDPFHAVAHDWPPTTVCHTGFTGVSVALDPMSRWWAVYLSNALPVAGDAGPILKARRLYHAFVAAHLRGATNDPVPTTS